MTDSKMFCLDVIMMTNANNYFVFFFFHLQDTNPEKNKKT